MEEDTTEPTLEELALNPFLANLVTPWSGSTGHIFITLVLRKGDLSPCKRGIY